MPTIAPPLQWSQHSISTTTQSSSTVHDWRSSNEPPPLGGGSAGGDFFGQPARQSAASSVTNRVMTADVAMRWRGFGTSIFTEMTDLARRLGAVNLAQGFPDFHGPAELLRAVEAHVATSHHQYAPSSGEERLRRAVAGFVRAST